MSTIRTLFVFNLCASIIAVFSGCSDASGSGDAAEYRDPITQVGGSSNSLSTENVGVMGVGGAPVTSGSVSLGGQTQYIGGVAAGGTMANSIATGGTAAGRTSTGGTVTGGTATGRTSTGGSAVAATGGKTAGKGLTIYYIRHAQVVANTLEPEQATYENSETLTDFGNSQVEALTKYLQGMGVTPDAVLVSPSRRTQKTIEPYLVAENIQGEIWMELMECCNQTPTGAALPTEPQYALYKASIEAENLTFREPAATKYWQNDTYEAGLFMVMTAKNAILSQFGQSGKTIFVVGHAAAGGVMVGLLRGNDMRAAANTTGSDAVYTLNTGIHRLVQDAATGSFKLDGRNINNPKTE